MNDETNMNDNDAIEPDQIFDLSSDDTAASDDADASDDILEETEVHPWRRPGQWFEIGRAHV